MEFTSLPGPFAKSSRPRLRRKSTSDAFKNFLNRGDFQSYRKSEVREANHVDGDKGSNADDDETQSDIDENDISSNSDDEEEKAESDRFKDDFAKIVSAVGDDGKINFDSLSGIDDARWSTMLKDLCRLGRSCVTQRLVDLPKDLDKFNVYQEFLKELLKAAPDLPAWANRESNKETTLHTALRVKHELLVRFFLKHAPNPTKQALCAKTLYKQNCLHVALNSRISIELLEELIDKAGKTALNGKGPGGDTVLHTAVDIKHCREGQSRIIQKILSISVKSLEKVNSNKLAPLQHLIQSRLEYEKQAKEVKQKKLKESNDIKSILMLECLRLMRDRKTTMHLLYGGQIVKGPAISFDIRDYQTIRYKDLRDSARLLNFEESLQSVILPDLEVVVSDTQKSKLRDSHGSLNLPPESSGRMDYWWIFQWLRSVQTHSGRKGVQRILKVSVQDNQDHPHSDETIEHCLRGFGVEILEWMKPDICATTIIEAVPDVRYLRMFCSGRNAVLRGWAAVGGLVELKQLRSLVVDIDSGFESANRMKKYAGQFEADFKRNRVDRLGSLVDVRCNILVSTSKGEDSANIGIRGDGRDNKQEWIECMSRYRDFLRNLDGPEDKAIKVALIDDGVDGFYADLSRYIEDGDSWSAGPDGDPNPFYRSSAGHGTIMATFIRRLCPNVKFYVARLQEKRTAGGKRSITAHSAAIDWAVSRKVDIISMSWTIDKTDENKVWIEKMETAIKHATAKKILVFCSVSDTGSLNDGHPLGQSERVQW
ncbi:hypothetical protein O1611_g2179 [Lasiodiplodia mahajangana]|uniref:Uncharacterized protein n=1 Tax=Lasiodiplodia mahajangana TaxID=1108764 RepID=A0ACC2JVB3_9PEZI|nr:hypothetical protein O1611_g2179 [Lasiodiplodia mahajangana]